MHGIFNPVLVFDQKGIIIFNIDQFHCGGCICL